MDTLILDFSVCLGGRVQVSPRLRKAGGRDETWPTDPQVCEYQEVVKLSRAIHQALQQAVEVMFCSDGELDLDAARGHLHDMLSLGVKLRESLLPDDLVARLQATPSIQHILFRCDPLLNGVMFDHIVLWNDFLCFRYSTGKELLTTAYAAANIVTGKNQNTYKGFSLVDPDLQLVGQGANDLRTHFDDFLGEWDTSKHHSGRQFREMVNFDDKRAFRTVHKKRVVEALRDHEFVNLVCHHVYDKENPDKSGLVLKQLNVASGEPEEIFSAQDLLDCLQSGVNPPLLMFSVSCESGITTGWETEWPNHDRLYGMVDAAIRCGIRHYISTIIKIPADRSPALMLPFYRAITQGKTVGQALRQAREALRDDSEDPLHGGTALGLAFVLYGDPADAYFCAKGHRTDQQRTVGCSEILPDGTVCGKVVCPQEQGFGQCRCNSHSDQRQPITCSAGHVVDNLDQLKICKKCNNTVCPECRGFAQSLCSEHISYNGHPIVGAVRKTCADPQEKHPNENRYVCPLDDGWMQGLCDDCLAAASKDANRNSCPKCARWIMDDNPWSDVVVENRAHQVCKACDIWDAQTEELQNISRIAEHFLENVATNLTEQTKRLDLMPKFRLSVWELLGPRPRILRGVKKSVADLSEPLGNSLRNRWQLPCDPWSPADIWLAAYAKVNQCHVHELRGLLTQPVLVAVVSLHPVKIELGQGAVPVPCDNGHLKKVENVFRDWWKTEHKRKISNLYIVVQSTTGWADGARPIYRSGEQFTIHVHPQANACKLELPPMDSRPEHIQDFVKLLTPKSLYQRRQEIREYIENYLKDSDFITNITAQEEIEGQTSEPVELQEVWEVFEQLAATGDYRLTEVNQKRALRPASPNERHSHWARRWWREIAVSGLLVLASLLGWLIPIVYKHQTTLAVGAIFAVVICYILSQSLKKFALFLKQT